MSASNWSVCPKCIERAKGLKEAFIEKYYGKLDAFVYEKMIKEVSEAVEHVQSYGDEEHNPDKEILDLMEEREISVTLNGVDYEGYEILQRDRTSNCLREDYEQGVNGDGSVYFYYSCSCDYCSFMKDVKFEESKHIVVERKE